MLKKMFFAVLMMLANVVFADMWVPMYQNPPSTMAKIVIQSATYSSMRKECDATNYVAMRCSRGGGNCSFQVSNNMCGDPDHGKQKVLQVVYQCAMFRNGQWYINNDAMSMEAFEHHNIEIMCGN